MPDRDGIPPLPPFSSGNTLLPSCRSAFRASSGPQGRIQSISQSFFAMEASLLSQGIEETRSPLWPSPDQCRLLEAPTCWEGTRSSRSGLFVSHPDRHKLLHNIQEVTFIISLDSICKIKSMEKTQIPVLESAGTNQDNACFGQGLLLGSLIAVSQ